MNTTSNSPNVSQPDIVLPNKWVLYLYDKSLFKKMASRSNLQAKPYRQLCELTTINEVIYLFQLMKTVNNNIVGEPSDNSHNGNVSDHLLNLDVNDYIIMRNGIEPIWEDPRNSNGGMFSVKMAHQKSFDIWSYFVAYILGETFSENMEEINGISVSYISDPSNFNGAASHSLVKIWDGNHNRTKDIFTNIMPTDLFEMIKMESIMYVPNNTKKNYGDKGIISRLRQQSGRGNRGGFTSSQRGQRRGRGSRQF
jgi:hypothetical protein